MRASDAAVRVPDALAPTMIGTLLFGLLLPGGPARAMGIALAYFITAFCLLRHALRTVTFERLLS